MADHCPADAPCDARRRFADTDDARISLDADGDWWLTWTPGTPWRGAAVLYCPWCGGRLVETAPPRCDHETCWFTATHGPDGKAIACWLHAGDWPEVPRV